MENGGRTVDFRVDTSSTAFYFNSEFVQFLTKLHIEVDQEIQHVVWHITNRCNLTCKYCFTNSSPFEEKEREEIGLRVAEFIGKLGPRQVSIIGGEPLLVPWLPNAIENIRNYSRPIINLDSNLTLLTPEIYSRLKGKVDYWNTTVDSYIPDIHNAVRGLFDATIKNIKYLIKNEERVKVVVVVGQHNVNHLEETVKFLLDLGVEEVVLSRLRPLGRGVNALTLHLDGEDLKLARNKVAELVKKYKNVKAVGWFHESVPEPRTQSCYCGRYRITVNWRGEVTPCEMGFNETGLNFSRFNIEDFYGWALTTSIYPAVCETCPISDRCPKACRYITMKLTGNPLARPVFCSMKKPSIYDVIGYERFSPIYKEGRARWKSTTAKIVERYALDFDDIKELGAGGGVWVAFLEEVLGKVAVGYEIDPTMLQLWNIYRRVKHLGSKIVNQNVIKAGTFDGFVLMLDNFVVHFPGYRLKKLFENVEDALLIEFVERSPKNMEFSWKWRGRTIRERVEHLGGNRVRRTFCNELYCASMEQYLYGASEIIDLLREAGFSRIKQKENGDLVFIYAEKTRRG